MEDMVVANRNRQTRTKIRQMVRRIIKQFHPEKIILFGSHARGDAGPVEPEPSTSLSKSIVRAIPRVARP